MQVAEITDVSQPYLSHVEMGRRNPSAETLSKYRVAWEFQNFIYTNQPEF